MNHLLILTIALHGLHIMDDGLTSTTAIDDMSLHRFIIGSIIVITLREISATCKLILNDLRLGLAFDPLWHVVLRKVLESSSLLLR